MSVTVMHLPCGHMSDQLDCDSICPVCDDSTEEEFDITGSVCTTNTYKCSETVCNGKRTAFFFPCRCHPFCNSCATTYFERQRSGFERCPCCRELIENIYEMQPPSADTVVAGGK